jgi:two-component system cell cycle response regulator
MIRVFSFSDETGLVPITDRLRYMGVGRVALTVIVLVFFWAVPTERAIAPEMLAAATAGYLLSTAASWWAWRLGRRVAIAVFGLTLLVDGMYIGMVAYSPDAMLTPLRYLIISHVIAVTLVASFRTGLKVAVWHTLLLWLDFQLRGADIDGYAAQEVFELGVFSVVVWLTAYCTAVFAAINERDLRRRGIDMSALAALAFELERTNSPSDVGRIVVSSITDTFAVERIAVVHAAAGRGAVLAESGTSPVTADLEPTEDHVLHEVMRQRSTLLVAGSDEARDPWLHLAFPGARNIVIVPMYADDRAVGMLIIEYGARRGSRIERRLVSMIERFASYASLALANAVLVDRISRLAATDGLTGAANRRAFDDRLASEVRRAGTGSDAEPVSLLIFDVDHFKRVNDEHGHTVGDEVLKHVVTVTGGLCRPHDLLARYGGEEFCLILPGTGAAEAMRIAERVRTELIASDPPVPVTVSIGAATAPQHGTEPADLVAAADAALYGAKSAGRNRSVLASVPVADQAATAVGALK